jgi:hypothetical protein
MNSDYYFIRLRSDSDRFTAVTYSVSKTSIAICGVQMWKFIIQRIVLYWHVCLRSQWTNTARRTVLQVRYVKSANQWYIRDFLFVYKDSYGQYVYVWINTKITERIFNTFSVIQLQTTYCWDISCRHILRSECMWSRFNTSIWR